MANCARLAWAPTGVSEWRLRHLRTGPGWPASDRSRFGIRPRQPCRADRGRARGARGERRRAGMPWWPTRCRRRSPGRSKRLRAGNRGGLSRRALGRGLQAAAARRAPRAVAPGAGGTRLDGFIVPRADEHQGEYVPPCGQRLAWLTGFTGSAGLAIVLRDRAAMFVDGRYTLQAAAQVDTEPVRDPPPDRRAAGALDRAALKPGAVLGYDPWLHTPHEVERSAPPRRGPARRCAPVAENPLDRVWPGRPAGADRAGGAAPRALRRREREVEAHPARPRAGRGGRRRGRADDARIDRLAAQHPRRRRAAHAAAAVLRDPAAGRLRHAVHRPAQARPRARAASRQRGDGQSPDRLGAGAGRARRKKAGGCRPTRQAPRPGFSTGSQPAGAQRSTAPPILACCRKPARTRSNSTARARRIVATAPRCRGFSPGWRARRQRAACARSPPATGSKPSAARASISGISASRRFRAPGRTARSSITAPRRRPSGGLSRARSICSIPARNTSTARPT